MEAKRTKHDHGVSLPEDIVFDVLARLPAKTLCQLRCVCKWWRTLISDPAFVTAQKSRAADLHLVGVFMGTRHVPEVRVMDMDGSIVRSFKITRCTPLPPQLHTRQDLICTDGRAGMMPLGGMIIDLAAAEAYDVFGTSYMGHWVMSSSIILGRATPSGDFKILCLEEPPFLMGDHGHAGSGHQLCEVATIMDRSGGSTAETLTWRRKPAPPFFTGMIREHRVIVNGIVYFIHEVETDGVRCCDPNLNCIVAFDLESEEWKAEAIIKGPTLGHKKEREIWSIALLELKGTLALVHDVCVKDYTYSSIWFLIDHANSVWVKEYMIPIPNNQIVTTKPLGVLVDGRILLWSSVYQEDETRQDKTSFSRYRKVVLLYDPSTKAFTDFMEITEGFMRYPFVLYTGSLLA